MVASLADSRIEHEEKWKRERTRIRKGYARKKKQDKGRHHETIRTAIRGTLL
jgi:hypothetical protein